MTTLALILPHEQKQFDSPPNFSEKDRALYFKLDQDAFKILKSLITPINRLGFILQFGYFKAQGKFFAPHQFKAKDI